MNVREPVVLLTEHDAPHQNGCIAKVLDFFGVASRNLTEAEARTDSPDAGVLEQARVLCSADVFLRMIENVERDPESTLGGISAAPPNAGMVGTVAFSFCLCRRGS